MEYQGVVAPSDGRDGIARRYRFRAGERIVDVLLPEAAATVWRQSHPHAGDDALDQWALAEARERVARRLREDPENPGEILLDSAVGNPDEAPRYGEGGQPHR